MKGSPGPDLLGGGVAGSVGQAAQDAALRHLQAGGHRGDAGQHGGQAGHVRLHVTQQLLQLVQDWGGRGRRGLRLWAVLTHRLSLRSQGSGHQGALLAQPSQACKAGSRHQGGDRGSPKSLSQGPPAVEREARNSEPTRGSPQALSPPPGSQEASSPTTLGTGWRAPRQRPPSHTEQAREPRRPPVWSFLKIWINGGSKV